MKKYLYLVLAVLTQFIAGCSGSDVYRGNWMAMDMQGHKYQLSFAAKSFTIKDPDGKTQQLGYRQNSVRIENGSKSYGLKLDDGRAFRVTFPSSGDLNRGVITLETGSPVYTIGRNTYVPYNELMKF